MSFRAHTLSKARSLGMTGYVKNTGSGTVVGTAQGPSKSAADLRFWLENVGSPEARIDRAVFNNFYEVKKSDYSSFYIDYNKG